jgi:hypothetical protein
MAQHDEMRDIMIDELHTWETGGIRAAAAHDDDEKPTTTQPQPTTTTRRPRWRAGRLRRIEATLLGDNTGEGKDTDTVIGDNEGEGTDTVIGDNRGEGKDTVIGDNMGEGKDTVIGDNDTVIGSQPVDASGWLHKRKRRNGDDTAIGCQLVDNIAGWLHNIVDVD